MSDYPQVDLFGFHVLLKTCSTNFRATKVWASVSKFEVAMDPQNRWFWMVLVFHHLKLDRNLFEPLSPC